MGTLSKSYLHRTPTLTHDGEQFKLTPMFILRLHIPLSLSLHRAFCSLFNPYRTNVENRVSS